MLCVRNIDVKEHHLSQVGVLTAQRDTSCFWALQPSPTYFASSYILPVVLSLAGEGGGGDKQVAAARLREESSSSCGELCSWLPPSHRSSWEKALQEVCFRVVCFPCARGRHTCKVPPRPWGSHLWPQNTDPRPEEETGSVTFPWANTPQLHDPCSPLGVIQVLWGQKFIPLGSRGLKNTHIVK